MTRPIRNTGPCFPLGLPRQRDVLSHTEFYTPIFCMLSVFQAIPFELQRKPPTLNRWDSTLGTPRGDKYYNQYRPQCEVCPRNHGKVVESLQGQMIQENVIHLQYVKEAKSWSLFSFFSYFRMVRQYVRKLERYLVTKDIMLGHCLVSFRISEWFDSTFENLRDI